MLNYLASAIARLVDALQRRYQQSGGAPKPAKPTKPKPARRPRRKPSRLPAPQPTPQQQGQPANPPGQGPPTPTAPPKPSFFTRLLSQHAGNNRLSSFGRSLHAKGMARFSAGQKGKQGAAQHAAKAYAGKGAAGRAGGAAKAAGAGSGAMLRFAGVAGMAAGAVIQFSKHISETTSRLIETNRQYAAHSASMAVVMAQRDLQEMRRSREKGDALADSAKELSDAEQRRKDAFQGIETAVARVENKLYATMNDGLAKLGEGLDGIFGAMAAKMGVPWAGGAGGSIAAQTLSAGDLLKAAQDDFDDAVARNDPWFSRPPI